MLECFKVPRPIALVTQFSPKATIADQSWLYEKIVVRGSGPGNITVFGTKR